MPGELEALKSNGWLGFACSGVRLRTRAVESEQPAVWFFYDYERLRLLTIPASEAILLLRHYLTITLSRKNQNETYCKTSIQPICVSPGPF
jgi:hypothetical protein